MKIFKKILKWFFIVLFVLLLFLVCVPFIFKGKIIEYAKKEINGMVNAKVDFGEIGVGIFQSFPNVSLELNDLIIIGVDEFKEDTLVKFDQLVAVLDIMSVFGDNIKVKAIVLDHPNIKIKVLKGGKANWDIMKESSDTTGTESDTSASNFSLALKKFEIINANIIYDDQDMGMYANIPVFNFSMKGDLTADMTSLETSLKMDSMTLAYEGVEYFRKANIEYVAGLDADLANMKFTFKENSLKVNELELGFNGSVDIPGEDIGIDLTFDAKKTEFKTLLSLIPAIYANDFSTIKTSGNVAFNGMVKGIYNDSVMPGYKVALLVENGTFQYPDLPASVSDIQIDLLVDNSDGVDDHMKIDLKKGHLNMGGTPVDMRLHVETPMSDPAMDGMVKGRIDLSQMKSFMPMEDASLTGIINADVEFSGRMSSIDAGKYEEFNAKGLIDISQMNYTTSDMLPVQIESASMEVSPQYFLLKSFKGKTGVSDFSLDGKIENFLAYAFRDELLKGTFNFNSALFNVNQFMGSEESTETAAADTSSSMTAFEVPDNVDFVLNTSIISLLYDNLEIKNAKGSVVIRDGSVDLTGFSMQVLDGTITMKGTYATKNSPVPVVNLGFNMVDVDIKKTYDAFTTLQKQAPILGKCSGRVSITLDYQGNLTSTMEPDMATVNGSGRLKTKSITVDNASVFNKLSEFVKSDKYKTLKFDNVDLAFTIKDGNIELEPMKTKFGKSEFEFGGKQSLDQALDYFMNIKIPSSELGAKANEIFAGMSNTASQLGVNIKVPEVIDVKGLIEGTVLEPKLKFNLKDQVNNVVEDVKEQVKEKINEEIDKAKEEAIRKAQEQADKLLKEADAAGQKLIAAAEQSAAQIRANAKTAADKIRSEADTQAQNLINQAKGKGFIAEKAAKESAEKIKKEAYKKATDLENTANNESNNVINKAKTESENLKKKAKEEGDKLIEAARK